MRVAVAFSLLGALCSLDCWRAQRAQHRRDGNAASDEATAKGKRQPPHIIFILTDDQGYNDIGYHNPTIKTPTLDKLAAEGVKLENYYVQPICTPSRSQLLTGRYQIHTGLQHSIIRPSQPSCLPSHMDTLPQRLQEAGYATHMVGKWHLGFYRRACLPTRKGFDSFFGSLTGSVDYYSYGSCDGPGLCGYDLHDNESVAWGQEGKYSTQLFTQKARKILESHDPTAGPLFLLLSLQAVHTPLQPPKSYIYPYHDMANVARRKFAAMVSTVDEAVHNVTYALRKYGYYRNSVIIYSTDNGAQPFTGGSNWPLRGRKGTYWEGGMRGVAFVHSPLLKRRRRVSKALLHITDWFPTLVGLAGGNISQSEGLDGFDVWATLSEGKESPRQEILHNIDPLHRSYAPTTSWGSDAKASGGKQGASVKTKRGPGLKPKKLKKKVLRQQPKQKMRFRAKTTKKPRVVSHHAPEPKSKSNPLPKPKLKLLPKSKLKPKYKSRVYSQHRPLFQDKSQLKSHSSGIPPPPHQNLPKSGPPRPKTQRQSILKSKSRLSLSLNQNQSLSGPPRPKSLAQNHSKLKSKSRRTSSQQRNLSLSGPPQPKSKMKIKLHSKSKSRRTASQQQNLSLSGPNLPDAQPTPRVDSSQGSQQVWDASVQAAIRVGDWKLLTGDPGHGDWVPPQVLPTLPGRWWNLERALPTIYKTTVHKNIWLFNITGDPYERRDLADQRPDVVQRLLARLAHYNQTAVPVYFPPDDPRANPDRHGGAWVPWMHEDEEEEGKYNGVYKKGKNSNNKKKRKKKKCRLCKLKSYFLKLNTGMMSNRI